MICRHLFFCLACLCLSLLLASPGTAGPLPDAVGPWRGASEDILPLKTASEDLGCWYNRVYTRSAPLARVEAILMEGAGPGTLRVPEGSVSADDFPIGFGARYRTIDIAGYRAILERQDLLGTVLAVALGPDRTLTLESAGASQEELAEFAKALILLMTQ